MAYIRRQKKGWQAQVERAGVRSSAVFPTKQAAADWAAKQEAELLAVKRGAYPRKTLSDAFERYEREISAKKRGARAEGLRLAAFTRDFPELAGKVISEVTTPDLVSWRDTRLQNVSPGSVKRDLNLLSHVFTVARKEWGWCGQSPITAMRRPSENPSRTRTIRAKEVRDLCRWLGYTTGKSLTKSQEVALAFLIALRTALRAGEVLQLRPDLIKNRSVAVQHKTQGHTGRPRIVPLSSSAVRLINYLPASGFSLSSKSLDALFRNARDSLLIHDLHFHDARRDALTRMARKLSPMDLAKVSGHKDLRILLNVYYAPTPQSISDALDRRG